ncbi:MAG: hypothetical protein EOP88_12160 [Verrucomicrobiaceae bacterium]|nr:MAG: hypothetical protein EOP88_12160 [Verrucomicrobiaceae bacterium]
MKTVPFILWACGTLALLQSLSGQNYETVPVSLQSFVTTEELPMTRKSEPASSQSGPSYLYQRPGTLDAGRQVMTDGLPVSGYGVLSISRRKVASGSETVLTENLALLSASYRASATSTASEKCPDIALAVTARINQDSSALLEIVQAETAANPSCACEIVKAAIQTTDGDVTKVLAIVETAGTTAPEHLRLISQCAIAAAPEALAEVQALLAKLDPGSGESGKSAKGAKAAVDAAELKTPEKEAANPLDLPPYQFIGPPIISPPVVTNVNP